MKVEEFKNIPIAVIDEKTKINSVEDFTDLLGNVWYNGCLGLVVSKASLEADFFDLKTQFAGQLLQKLVNYQMKIAIVGDFSMYKSKALKDFIRESNRGNSVFFVNDVRTGKKEIYKNLT